MQTKDRYQQNAADPKADKLVVLVVSGALYHVVFLEATPCSFFPWDPRRRGKQEFLVPTGVDFEHRRVFYGKKL